ncbi:MAG TPA: hypothetical protein VKZ93_09260 [Arenibacter sp.]|nr:hypothetical protein [Arenibacter sp.]
MRYFLISGMVLLLMACGSYPKKNNFQKVEKATMDIINPYFSDRARDYVYKAKITFADKSFGGLFVVKKLDEDQYRVVFTTEMGNKLMDFSFEGNTFKVNYILEEMDKKILIDLLRKDFYVLIRERSTVIHQYAKQGDTTLLETRAGKGTYFYYLYDNKLQKVIGAGNGKEKTIYDFLEIDGYLAKEIDIIHKRIKLSIHLKAI